MTEEKADQIIRCVKECWWRLTVFSLALLFFSAFIIHGWPVGDWSLGWGMIGAIGTLLTGLVAIQISNKQTNWIKEKRQISGDIFEKKLLNNNGFLFSTMSIFVILMRYSNNNITYFSDNMRLIVGGSVKAIEGMEILIESVEIKDVSVERYNEIVEMLDLLRGIVENCRFLSSFDSNSLIIKPTNKNEVIELKKERISELVNLISRFYIFSNNENVGEFNNIMRVMTEEVVSNEMCINEFLNGLRKNNSQILKS